jgi:type II secretory pathway pseudopilin PulG
MWSWLWSWWDTVEDVETFNLVMLILLGTAAALAAVGIVLARRHLARLKSQRDAAQQAKQAAREQVLRQQIAKRERELREVQAPHRARTLTLEQVQALIPRLRVGPKGKVQIEVLGDDPEADQFGEQFYEVLMIAGWPLEGSAQVLSTAPPVGLQLGASPAGMPPHGAFLLQALRDVGLDVLYTAPIRGPDQLVHLVVGAQPRPRHTP